MVTDRPSRTGTIERTGGWSQGARAPVRIWPAQRRQPAGHGALGGLHCARLGGTARGLTRAHRTQAGGGNGEYGQRPETRGAASSGGLDGHSHPLASLRRTLEVMGIPGSPDRSEPASEGKRGPTNVQAGSVRAFRGAWPPAQQGHRRQRGYRGRQQHGSGELGPARRRRQARHQQAHRVADAPEHGHRARRPPSARRRAARPGRSATAARAPPKIPSGLPTQQAGDHAEGHRLAEARRPAAASGIPAAASANRGTTSPAETGCRRCSRRSLARLALSRAPVHRHSRPSTIPATVACTPLAWMQIQAARPAATAPRQERPLGGRSAVRGARDRHTPPPARRATGRR